MALTLNKYIKEYLGIEETGEYLETDINQFRFSPEIEWVGANRTRVYEDVMNENLNWKVVYDASLYEHSGVNADNTGEIMPKITNELYYGGEGMLEVEKVFKILKKHSAKADDYCGLHFHIDATPFHSYKQIVRLFSNVYNIQDMLYKILNIRENGAKYARLLQREHYYSIKRSSSWKEMRNNWYNPSVMERIINNRMNGCWTTCIDSKYNCTRYSILNLHSLFYSGGYGTVEFRCFNSTMSIDEFNICLKLVLHICENSTKKDQELLFNRRIRSLIEFMDLTKDIFSKEEFAIINKLYTKNMKKRGIATKSVDGFNIPQTIVDIN